MTGKRQFAAPVKPDAGDEHAFAEVVRLIEQARQRAYQAVNTELIGLCWKVGRYISRKIEAAEWGEGVVEKLAEYIRRRDPNIRGFTRRNLFRMRQFYETYAGDKKVSPLVTQLPWTHNLIIMGQPKLPEEREFYLRMAIQERWGKEVVEYALSRSLSPALVAEYQTQLPDKNLLQAKLREFYQLAAAAAPATKRRRRTR
jgi:predicted nuclease of restriction endonuclease-like (RecB) superfamily